ncbi:MAG: hypothetical protein WAN36_03900, partial [Calditrichia bacterium]
MISIKQNLFQVSNKLESIFDKYRFRAKSKLGRIKPLEILPYTGFGNHEKVYIKGRVLEKEGKAPPDENEGIWKNLKTMYKRFESDEIPGVTVKGIFNGEEKETTTDDEGYFDFE